MEGIDSPTGEVLLSVSYRELPPLPKSMGPEQASGSYSDQDFGLDERVEEPLQLESEGRSNYESDSFESIAKASSHASHSSVRDAGDSGSDCDEKKDTKIRAEQPSRNPRGKTKAEKKAAAQVL